MRRRNVLHTALTASLTLLPSHALATAGLGELDEVSSLIVMTFFFLAMTLVPLGLGGTWMFVWYFAWLQLPLILSAVLLAGWMLYRKKARKLTYLLVLLPLYALLTLSTNMVSFRFSADHSDYFPKERLVNRLCGNPGQTDKPTEAEVVAVLGQPLAAGSFRASSAELPDGMAETMKTSSLESSYILSYVERCRGRKAMEEHTYYILLDPETHRYVTHVIHYGTTEVQGKWPHQPTGSCGVRLPTC